MFRSCIVLGIFVASTFASPACHQHDPLIVRTKTGSIHGVIDPKFPNVRQFLGIPFAQPPLDDLRFAPPEQVRPWPGTLEATSLPLSCPQTHSNQSSSIYTQDVLEFSIQGLNYTAPFTEDCLTLSVWAPSTTNTAATQPLPVLIFITGGGFTGGGMNIPYQIPTQWIARTPDHIVVTLNYRVNIFGFPSSRGLDADKLNLGLLDQRLAVEWVAANIAAFGGDPGRIVLWGQSAGAASIASYAYAYPEKPLVAGFVQDSGTESILGTAKAEDRGNSFSIVAEGVGCGGMSSAPADELACMRKVSAEKINTFIEQYSVSNTQPSLEFQPLVDEKLVFSNWTTGAVEGRVAKLVRVNLFRNVPLQTLIVTDLETDSL